MAPLRILHIHTRYRQPGGEDRVVDAERSLLQGAGHTVIPFDASNSPTLTATGQFVTSGWNPAAAMNLARVVDEHEPDVAHIHNTFFALSPSVIRSVARKGTPVVMTLHNYRMTCIAATLSRNGEPCELCVGANGWAGIRHRCYQDSLLRSSIATFAKETTKRTASRYVSGFAVLTDFARDLFIRSGLDPERLIVLPNFADDPGPRTRAAANSRTVLFVGRLSREKGIDRFLEYWKGADPDLQLVVAGDGPLSAELRSGHPKIDFRGRLDPEQVSELMLEARALVFPSTWYEGQSLVLLEAMAAGLPIVATDWPPVRDTVGPRAGHFVPVADPRAWESSIQEIMDDAWADRASRASRQRWEINHSPNAGLSRLERLYGRAIGDRETRGRPI